jgi:hypothetical protein
MQEANGWVDAIDVNCQEWSLAARSNRGDRL